MTKAERDILLTYYENAIFEERLAYGKHWHSGADDTDWLTAKKTKRWVEVICIDVGISDKYLTPAKEAGTQRAFRYFDSLGWDDARDAVSD